ncbi:uncharacterized protein LOC122312796 [Carya illinoinensis]|uniref:uncharacterized protein LOC122312796 n=1 Tax=Carya illinoinensis TaxID=32201 RepID=UPI001C720D64|nr:uncharacterized protein LOC122312796 [Carya illinoinensis]
MARSWAKLDRMLVNNEFALKFGTASAHFLERRTSDNAPLLVQFAEDYTRYGPMPFHFQNMWVAHEEFLKIMESSWKELFPGNGLLVLAGKLKRLKVTLKRWNKEVFGRMEGTIRELEERVEVLDVELQNQYTRKLECDFLKASNELDQWVQREDTRLRQQAKQRWMEEGDQNTKYFHVVIAQRRRNAMVKNMKLSGGRLLESPVEIHEEATRYFERFLSEEENLELPDLSTLISSVVGENEERCLRKPPSDQEIYEALLSIPKDSSLGPDGFSSQFYLTCWEIVRMEVSNAVMEFFQRMELPRFYTASFIVLIPKSSFGVPGDFSDLIKNCVTTLWFSIMLNETFKGFFKSKRGLRQGDPLSPYLFIIMEEVLSKMIKGKVAEKKIQLFSHPVNSPVVSHLLYADDIVLFTNASKGTIRCLMNVFKQYERWTGQKVNYEKSAIYYSKKISNQRINDIRRVTGFVQCEFPCKYLGAPIVDGRLKARHLDYLVAKLLTEDSLWANFFRAKYVKNKQMCLWLGRRSGSNFWRKVVEGIPFIIGNSKWKVHEGDLSFWYDKFLDEGMLCDLIQQVEYPDIRIRELVINDLWDIGRLQDMIGNRLGTDVMETIGKLKNKKDVLIWLPNKNGLFSIKSAWDILRVKGQVEDLDHVLGSGQFARSVWCRVSAELDILFVPQQRWRERVYAWFSRASRQSQLGMLLGLVPVIVTWRLWKRRCTARMEGKHEKLEVVWRSVMYWIRYVLKKIGTVKKLSKRDIDILKKLNVNIVEKQRRAPRIVKWATPSLGRFKLNIDGNNLGNPGEGGGGGILRDNTGMLRFAFTEYFGHCTNNEAKLRGVLEGLLLCKQLCCPDD